MKKYVITAVAATTILVSSALAQDNMKKHGHHMKEGKKCNMQKGNCNKKSKMMAHGNAFMHIFYKLNLSDEQYSKIDKIIVDAHKKSETIADTFTEKEFNKDKFVKMEMSKKENMIKKRAMVIEKIYDLLTTKQKKQFKVLIDLKTERFK